jgi:hypothetical protein
MLSGDYSKTQGASRYQRGLELRLWGTASTLDVLPLYWAEASGLWMVKCGRWVGVTVDSGGWKQDAGKSGTGSSASLHPSYRPVSHLSGSSTYLGLLVCVSQRLAQASHGGL